MAVGLSVVFLLFFLVLSVFAIARIVVGDRKRRVMDGCVDVPPWSGSCAWTVSVQVVGSREFAFEIAIEAIQRSSKLPVIEVELGSWSGWTSRNFELGISVVQVEPQLHLLRCASRPRYAGTLIDFGQSRKAAETLAQSVMASVRV